MTTSTDKDLAQLLQPLQESLAGINRSLRTLADIRLLQTFGPEQHDRKNWTEKLKQAHQEDDQALFEQSLLQRMRPVLVGNPDVSAPHPHQFSAEPGYWMARAMKSVPGLRPRWLGKPHLPAFQLAVDKVNQLAAVSVPKHRIAMVGDSLHTDILGGVAAGLGTILVTNYGLLRAHDANQLCADMQICPDWQVELI